MAASIQQAVNGEKLGCNALRVKGFDLEGIWTTDLKVLEDN